MEENMIRGAILAMQVDNNTKTKLFKYLTNLEELKTEHKTPRKNSFTNLILAKKISHFHTKIMVNLKQ